MLRAVAPADDLLVVVRAVGDDIAAAIADMVADALDSAGTYAVERGGVREVLCGVSVFALGDSVDVAEVLARFPDAPRYLRLTVGALRSAGFEVLATGSNSDHFDIQLVSGVADMSPDQVPDPAMVRQAAETVARLAGPSWPNPVYS